MLGTIAVTLLLFSFALAVCPLRPVALFVARTLPPRKHKVKCSYARRGKPEPMLAPCACATSSWRARATVWFVRWVSA